MLKDLPIGKQIGIGIGLILLVSALVAMFAINGLQRSAASFAEYRTFARESILSGRVQANMLIASNATADFLRTREEESAETFEERFHAAREFAIEQQASMDDPGRLEMSKQLVESLESKAKIARNVADGNLGTSVELLSERDTMGHSLQEMLATLKEREEESKLREWARDGQEKLNDEMRGVLEQDELIDRVIGLLCHHMAAQRGAFYVTDADGKLLHYVGGFATGEKRQGGDEVKIGVGLLGQAARDREAVIVDEVPADYFKIESSLGEVVPGTIAILPLSYEDQLLGIVELASVGKFTREKIDFFKFIQESICVALIAAKRQQELKELLEQTQGQAVELKAAQKATDAANKAKSEFLSNMSHELRTPLNGVLGYVQILQRDRSLGAPQKKSLDSINNCGEHLLNLINDVLDLSKIEAGELEISPAPTDLSQLIDGVRDIVKPRAEGKGLRFAVKASAEVPRGITWKGSS